MKRVVFAASVLMLCLVSSRTWAQNCKPDVSREDRITKEAVNVWAQELWSTSFLSSVVNTSEVGITATIGRYGDVNAINLQIQKKEESATNAAFDAAYRGAKGRTFYFGFKNGEPAAFTVTEAGNAANVKQGLFGAKGVTSVVLSAAIADEDLARLRDQLTSRYIDAVRISLSGDLLIDKAVNDGNGKKMMENFSCFFRFLDEKGIVLSAGSAASATKAATSPAVETPPGGDYSAWAPGKYLHKGGGKGHKPTDFTELGSDGTFYGEGGGAGVSGTYTVKGDVLTLVLPTGQAFRAKFVGNRIEWSDGSIEEKEAPSVSRTSPGSAMTVEQIIQMTAAKLPDDVIVASIVKAGAKFDLTPELLIRLKTSGVSDAVIRAMTKD